VVVHTGADFLLKDCSLWRGPVLERGKSVKRKEQQREAITLHLLSSLGCLLDDILELAVKKQIEPGKVVMEKYCFHVCIFVSHYPNLLSLVID